MSDHAFSFPMAASKQAIERATAVVERASVAPDRAEEMAAVDVGETPSEVVYEENKLELHHYRPESENAHGTPILVVYALINRPYILDLQPNRSVVRRLLDEGFEVYLIDWGEPSRLDASLGVADYVLRYVHNCVNEVREREDVDDVHLLGYCMGGTMSAMYAALYPERVRTLSLMAAGLCFDGDGGVLELWGGEDEYFDPESIREAYGLVPAEFFATSFDLMDPIANTYGKYVRLYENVEDEDFVKNFARMERWLDDGIDMAGRTYAEFIRDIYQENKLARGELELNGREVSLDAIDMPVLQIVGEYDHLVPPEASLSFTDLVASDDTHDINFPVGHIGLSVSSRSHEELWPEVAEWLADRSLAAALADLESIDGIGSSYAASLREAGVETVEELAAADPEELAEQSELPKGRVADWVAQARER